MTEQLNEDFFQRVAPIREQENKLTLMNPKELSDIYSAVDSEMQTESNNIIKHSPVTMADFIKFQTEVVSFMDIAKREIDMLKDTVKVLKRANQRLLTQANNSNMKR